MSQIHNTAMISFFLLLLASSCSSSRLPPFSEQYYFDAIDFDSFGEDAAAATTTSSFNVMDYGAVGNGQTDDSQAFNKAWEALCSASGYVSTLEIPPGKTFLLKTMEFDGPCKANNVHVKLRGNLVAPEGTSWTSGKDIWISFRNVNNLIINGGGTISGKGSAWWGDTDKKGSRPTALHFSACNGLVLRGLTHVDSARNHISICQCNGVSIFHSKITAPMESPNTDGIDISGSTNVRIIKSFIRTGDDCVAINGGSAHISITNVECGPGHGISIGSLGHDGAFETVEDVTVEDCTFIKTTNGARIKTWKGGRGYARNITFNRIKFIDVENPIIIDQFYSDKSRPNDNTEDIQVSQVTFSNMTGTSASEAAISFSCSEDVGCHNVVLNRVDITSAVPGKIVHAICSNVQGTATSVSPTVPCLSQ